MIPQNALDMINNFEFDFALRVRGGIPQFSFIPIPVTKPKKKKEKDEEEEEESLLVPRLIITGAGCLFAFGLIF